jgi:hypothetical protein
MFFCIFITKGLEKFYMRRPLLPLCASMKYLWLLLSIDHSRQICETRSLLAQILRGESHFSQKWLLANVGESGESVLNGLASVSESSESVLNGLASVGECLFSTYLPNSICVSHNLNTSTSQPQHATHRRRVCEYSRHSPNLQNSRASGRCLVTMDVLVIESTLIL